jgi:hypothetical protein
MEHVWSNGNYIASGFLTCRKPIVVGITPASVPFESLRRMAFAFAILQMTMAGGKLPITGFGGMENGKAA